ncbi:hypothetical protein [Dactylosporangium sp. NPDC005555]|uniref:hypothetical protein n=1 Tax=Dactylosporangium sp. NPDC005555 TaxID=3154889 RepID=UPI0033B43A2A
MSVPYKKETPVGWAGEIQRTWTVTDIPDGVRLAGDCPTCAHPTESLVRSTWVAHGVPVDPDTKALPRHGSEKVLVVCACAAEHGAPPDGRGCGRAGYLLLVPDGTP